MNESSRDAADAKARRKADWEFICAYHDQQLRQLQAHVRDGVAQLDAGAIDAFELDALIHHYKRASQKLWSFCNTSPGGADAAQVVQWWRERGEPEADWWEAGRPRRRGE